MNRRHPTDKEIADAFEMIDLRIMDIRRAAMVTEDYVEMELSAGNCGNFKDRCWLTPEQVDGITYMLRHLRELAQDIEAASSKALGRGDAA